MTPNDDATVRDLAERIDEAVPDMAVDPAGVLALGRRYRRRRTAMRSGTAVVAVAAVALGGAQLSAGLRGDPGPAPAAQLVTVDDFTVLAATEALPVDPDGEARPGTLTTPGTLYDTGVPVDPADPAGDTWVLENVELSPEDVVGLNLVLRDEEGEPIDAAEPSGELITHFLAARSFDPRTGDVGERIPGGSLEPGDGFNEPTVEPSGMAVNSSGEMVDSSDPEVGGTFIAFGLAGPDYTPHVYVIGEGVADQHAEESRVLVPTFSVPGVDGRLYFVRVAGERPWPHVTVYPDQHVGLQLHWNPGADPWGR